MTRYIVLLKFTESGISQAAASLGRADEFRARAAEVGATVESVYWTLGMYDGMFVLSAPDEATAAALVLELGKGHNVQTTMMRAFDAAEFKAVVDKMA